MTKTIRKYIWAFWERWVHLIARSYIVGPELGDAVNMCRRLAQDGTPTTICYWNSADDKPDDVAAAYGQAVSALAKEHPDGYVSIKAPALGFDRSRWSRVYEKARELGVPLHFDSLAPEEADQTFTLIEEGLSRHTKIGCTLPGRWRRSIKDADWAVEKKLPVRVVKGQWADKEYPDLDLRAGFLSVIDRLAGRAVHVAVASHDASLVEESLKRLMQSNTSCELELLFGLPLEPARSIAQAAGVRVRLYLPYGHGWLPYSLSQLSGNPYILWWIIRDFWSARLGPLNNLLRTR